MKQYSRCKNLTKKDQNTIYFHTLASYTKKRNHIPRIIINGSILTEVNMITEGIRNYFEEHYKQENLPNIELPPGVFRKFDDSTRDQLENLPTEAESKAVVWSCDTNKTPRYDGFNISFVKEMWSTIGADVIRFF